MGGRRNIVLLVVACVAVLAVLIWLKFPRDEPSRATVDDAVQSFRAESDGERGEAHPGRPAFGVYRYETRGSESVQTPIVGTTHDYDGVSTIVLSAGPCGVRERWQVLAGRWTEGESCADRFVGGKEFHEFFGVAQEDTFRCDSTSRAGPAKLRPGARFSSSCESDDSSISNASRIVGFDTVSVDGEAFPVIHLETRSRLEGGTSGTAKREEWRRRSDGLLLRRSASSDADSSEGGGTHYTENYTIQLLDTEPRR